MKRARSTSVDSDAASSSPELMPSSRAASSSSSSSAVEEFEEPDAVPLLSILGPILSLLRERESVADALRRLAKDKKEELDTLTDLHHVALAQHELVLMNMSREAVLLKALAECRRTNQTLPHVWMLRWLAKPETVHGPFSEATIQQWHNDGFFGKKAAELRDINAVSAAWVPALTAMAHTPSS